MWCDIKTQNDAINFMKMTHCFHDSCIKEIKYVSGAYVDDDLSMYPINDKRLLKIIVQSQFENLSVIEMEFTGLKYMKLFPVDNTYTCEIHGATMLINNNCIYWCDEENLTQEEIDIYGGNSICASGVKWRVAKEYLGKKEVYTKDECKD